MSKFWVDCSKEEHREIRQWTRDLKLLRFNYVVGVYTKRQYLYRKKKLAERLDEIELKYSDS